jgi:transcriptional regulator with XRE-family HTH domain
VHQNLPSTRAALAALGAQIAVARRELGWTAADLAERLGVTAKVVTRIERGEPGTAIGTVFEAAVICGVPLFGVEAAGLADVAERERARLALLPQRVRRPGVTEVSDDF